MKNIQIPPCQLKTPGSRDLVSPRYNGFRQIGSLSCEDSPRVFRYHPVSLFSTHNPCCRLHTRRKDGWSPIGGMGVRGDQVCKPFQKQLPCNTFHRGPKSTRQTHGGNLAEATHSDHSMVSLKAPPHLHISLGVTDNGDESSCNHPKQNILGTMWHALNRELDEKAFPAVPHGHHLSVAQLMKGLVRKMNIGTRQDPDGRLGPMDSRPPTVVPVLATQRLELDQGSIEFLDLGQYGLPIILVHTIEGMRRCYHGPDAIMVRDFTHLE